jgi:hypothetical protein
VAHFVSSQMTLGLMSFLHLMPQIPLLCAAAAAILAHVH